MFTVPVYFIVMMTGTIFKISREQSPVMRSVLQSTLQIFTNVCRDTPRVQNYVNFMLKPSSQL